MIPQIAERGTNMIEEWENLVSSGSNEIDVLKEFTCLTSDIISGTAFGSSYAEGKYMFHLLSQWMMLLFERSRSIEILGSMLVILALQVIIVRTSLDMFYRDETSVNNGKKV